MLQCRLGLFLLSALSSSPLLPLCRGRRVNVRPVLQQLGLEKARSRSSGRAGAGEAEASAGKADLNDISAAEEVPELSAEAREEAMGIARAVAELDRRGSTFADYFATTMDVLTFSAVEGEAKCLAAPGNPRLGCALQGCSCPWLEECYPKYLDWTATTEMGHHQQEFVNVGSCQPTLLTFAALSFLIFLVTALGVACMRAGLLHLAAGEEEATPPLMRTKAPIRIATSPIRIEQRAPPPPSALPVPKEASAELGPKERWLAEPGPSADFRTESGLRGGVERVWQTAPHD